MIVTAKIINELKLNLINVISELEKNVSSINENTTFEDSSSKGEGEMSDNNCDDGIVVVQEVFSQEVALYSTTLRDDPQ